MARTRKGDKVDGWVVLDKPLGPSSAGAVGKVRWLFHAAKAGHAGTLDPLATGILVIALGEATKLVPYVMDAPKRYRFTVRWGEARATDDAEGEVTATSAVRPSRAAIELALPGFRGTIQQIPPVYSALKLAGQPAYARARAGEDVVLAARSVTVDRFELIEIIDENSAVFEADCSKGTYVRSLARDLAVALGTVGHVAALRRTAVGRFDESLAIGLDNLEALGHIPGRLAYLHPVETALDDIPALAVTEDDGFRLRRGQAVPIPRAANRDLPLVAGQVVAATLLGRLVALTRVEGESLQPLRVLNT
jgi:tRNA pseudouridine55 synthase